MPVAEQVMQTLLLAKAADIEAAMARMRDAEAKQRRLKTDLPDAYDEAFHAAGIAQHIQGIYTQIESLIKQSLEMTDGKLPKSETWYRDLIRLASTPTHDRNALVDAAGAKNLKEVLGFRHIARSNYAGELDPPRVFEHIATTAAAVEATVTGVRQMFESPEA
jgi:hypothetical protein